MQHTPTDPKKPDTHLFPLEEMEDMQMQATSETDMTGLIPTGMAQMGEIENYAEIYPYLPPYVDNDQM